MSKNTEYSRAWRRKLQAKAQLLDELAAAYDKEPLDLQTDLGPEADYARAYVKAHPWAVYCAGIYLCAWDDDADGLHLGSIPYGVNMRAPALLAAALRATTSRPVSGSVSDRDQEKFEALVSQAADITRRMREAGIWTGPR